jgi:catechol 2,3-dioxygenase
MRNVLPSVPQVIEANASHSAPRQIQPSLSRIVVLVASTPGAAADLGHGPAYRFTDPDGHAMELYWETERYTPPDHLKPSLKNQPQRYTGRGAAIKRLDHVNVLAEDVRANRDFAEQQLGFRLYERIQLDDGSESGAWLSLSIAAHELIYVRDAYGARGRLHHLAFWVDTREEVLRAADLFLDSGIEIEAARGLPPAPGRLF